VVRLKLPADFPLQLPEGAAEVQRVIANYLGAKPAHWPPRAAPGWRGCCSPMWADHRRTGRRAPAQHPTRPAGAELAQRIALFGEAFRQIVAAQFWIAAFNTLLTALFLLFILPYWGIRLPYTPLLISSLCGGLVPIVGNLVCNVVHDHGGLSVSPLAAAACLGSDPDPQGRIRDQRQGGGQRTHMGVWELLSVMFVAEAVFGPAGLVAAPLCLEKELASLRLI
jgi:hypothetical protein